MGLLFVVIVVLVVVSVFPVGGPVFLGSPEGIIVLAAVAALGGSVGDHFGDYLSERDKKREEHDAEMRKGKLDRDPAPSAN